MGTNSGVLHLLRLCFDFGRNVRNCLANQQQFHQQFYNDFGQFSDYRALSDLLSRLHLYPDNSRGEENRELSMGALDLEEEFPAPLDATPEIKRTPGWKLTAIWIFLAIVVCLIPPIANWQIVNQQKMLSSTNIRKVGNALLIYSQDWDYRLPPPAERIPSGVWVNWAQRIRPYLTSESVFSNPANPIEPFNSKVTHPTEPRSIDSSYALNQRFWNSFSPGPFPTENLELPGETALLVEAGVMNQNQSRPLFHFGSPTGKALDIYGDTTDRIEDLIPYPAVHEDQTVVIALDGHSVASKPAHSDLKSGPHDPMYGRIVNGIFNWNGGHANGETDRPVRE